MGPAGAAEAQHRRARGPRVPLRRRRALAPLRDRRLAARRARARSTTRPSGRSSGGAAARSDPDAYLVGEIWRVAPDWLRGDRFDALMNYPLAEAILGFAGGVAARHGGRPQRTTSTRRSLRPLDGPAFAARLVELAAAYDPRRRRGPAQPARLPRHAAAADGARRRRRRRPAGHAAPGDPARRAVHLLRRRDRADRRRSTRTVAARSPGTRRAGSRGCASRCAACSGCGRREPRPARRTAARGRRRPAARSRSSGGAAASRFVVAVNAGDDAVAPRRSDSRTRPSGAGGHLAPIDLPGVRRDRRDRAIVGRARRRSSLGPRSAGRPPGRADGSSAIPSYSAVCGRSTHRPRRRARRPTGPRPRCRGEDPAGARRLGSGRRDATCCCSMAPTGSARGNSPSSGRASTFAGGGRARRGSTRPTRRPTSWSACWTPVPWRRPRAETAEAARVLRPGGRLLVVLDYGRDDVSRLRGDLPEYGALSRRDGPLPA